MAREVTVRISATDAFSNVTQRYQREMGQAEAATKRASSATDQFGKAVQGAVAAISIQQVVQFAEGFNLLGRNVIQAEAVFERLNGGVAESERLLGRLQSATGGVIDNLTLMQGANRFVSMGLGETQQEIARLTELAVKLGAAMGHDATSSIENFGLLLANESILRLDTFGISSARVRERIDELLASGEALNRSEAFRMAVLEIGGDSLTRLGDAAQVGETALAKLQSRLNNLWQQGAENFAVGLESIIHLLTVLAEKEQELHDQVQRGEMSEIQFLGTSIAVPAEWDPWTAEQRRQEYLAEQADPAQFGQGFAARLRDEARRQAALVAAEQERLFAIERMNAAANDYLAPIGQQAQSARNAAGIDIWGGINDFPEFMTTEQAARIRDAADQAAVLRDAAVKAQADGFLNAGQLQWAQDAADQIERYADEAERAATAFENLTLAQAFGQGQGTPLGRDIARDTLQAATDSGLYSEEQLAALSDTLGLWSGEVTDLSLQWRDDLLPMLAEIGAQFGDGALTQAMDRLTQEIQAAALEGRNPDLMGAAGYGYLGGGGGRGFTVNPGDSVGGVAQRYGMSIDEVLRLTGAPNDRSMQPGNYGGGGGGGLAPISGGPADGWGMYRAGERGDMTGEETPPEERALGYLEEIGIQQVAIAEETAKAEASWKQIAADTEIAAGYAPDLAKDAGVLAGHMKEVEEKGHKFRDTITELTGKVNVVRIRIDVNDPKNLLGLFNSNPSMFETVKDNGGIVPGT